jgi:hypothetical protein
MRLPVMRYRERQSDCESGRDKPHWSIKGAGSGLLTALARGSGGGGASLNMKTGRLTTSLSPTAQCHQ